MRSLCRIYWHTWLHWPWTFLVSLKRSTLVSDDLVISVCQRSVELADSVHNHPEHQVVTAYDLTDDLLQDHSTTWGYPIGEHMWSEGYYHCMPYENARVPPQYSRWQSKGTLIECGNTKWGFVKAATLILFWIPTWDPNKNSHTYAHTSTQTIFFIWPYSQSTQCSPTSALFHPFSPTPFLEEPNRRERVKWSLSQKPMLFSLCEK